MLIGSLVKTADFAATVQPELDKLRQATCDIEAIFFKDILSAMRKTVPDNGGQGYGAEIYQDLFDTALSRTAASTGSFGISELLYKTMAKAVIAQEKARLDIEAEKPTTENEG